jgi:hypothetical protein
MVGLGVNAAEDAVYPALAADADGRPPTGDHDYVLHFDRDELPPGHAFWSVTMYDAQGFQAANALNRFAIGDRDALRYNPGGSLGLYLQHASPGPSREANWLPAPRGPLGVTMRLYSPKASVLTGTWAPPTVRRAGLSRLFVALVGFCCLPGLPVVEPAVEVDGDDALVVHAGCLAGG